MHVHVKRRVSHPRPVSEGEVPCQPAEMQKHKQDCHDYYRRLHGCPALPATFKGEPFANKVSNIALVSAKVSKRTGDLLLCSNSSPPPRDPKLTRRWDTAGNRTVNSGMFRTDARSRAHAGLWATRSRRASVTSRAEHVQSFNRV